MLQPLLATPAEKSWIDDVSWAPVRRRSLSWEVDQVKILSQYNPHNNLCLLDIASIRDMIHTFPSLGSYALICLTWCLRTIILMLYWTTIILKCYLESFSMADSIAFIPPATLKVCHHISTATQSFTLCPKHQKYSKWAAPHRLSREVCMSSSSVPVAHHWLQ